MLQQQAVPITGSQAASAPSVVQVKDFIEEALPANSNPKPCKAKPYHAAEGLH